MAGGEVPGFDVGQFGANDDVGVAQFVLADDAAHDGRRLPEDGRDAVDRLAAGLAGDIDGDDEVGAHVSRGLNRHRAGQSAVDIGVAAKLDWLENAGHGG